MSNGLTGEHPVLTRIPGLVGLFALLFFFSVLDPVSLIFVQVSSLLFFFAANPSVRAIGLLGLSGFVYMVFRAGEFTPASAAILFSGVVFGSMLRFRRFRTVFYPSLLSGVATLLMVMVAFLLFDPGGLHGWIGEIKTVMMDALEASFLRIQETGAFGIGELVELRSALNGVVELMVILMPAAVCLNILLAGVIGITLLHLSRTGGCLLPRTRELRYFTFNDTFVWGFILGLLSLLLPFPEPVRTILMNILALSFVLYLLRGMAVGVFWLRGKGFSTMAIGAAYAFMFAILPPLFILCLLLPGVLDTWFDFRSPREVIGE